MGVSEKNEASVMDLRLGLAFNWAEAAINTPLKGEKKEKYGGKCLGGKGTW